MSEPEVDFDGYAGLTGADIEGVLRPAVCLARLVCVGHDERVGIACAVNGRFTRKRDGERRFADGVGVDGKRVVSVCRERLAVGGEACRIFARAVVCADCKQLRFAAGITVKVSVFVVEVAVEFVKDRRRDVGEHCARLCGVAEGLVVARVESDRACNEVGIRRVGLQSLVAERPTRRVCRVLLLAQSLAFFEVVVLGVVFVESTVGEGVGRRRGRKVCRLDVRARACRIVNGLRNDCAVDVCDEHRAARESARRPAVTRAESKLQRNGRVFLFVAFDINAEFAPIVEIGVESCKERV